MFFLGGRGGGWGVGGIMTKHKMAPGKKLNQYYRMLPPSVRSELFLNRISSLLIHVSPHFVHELSYQYLKIVTHNMMLRTNHITHNHL